MPADPLDASRNNKKPAKDREQLRQTEQSGDDTKSGREHKVSGKTVVNLTIDSIEKAARASVEANLNTRLHELLSDLFDEQYAQLKRLADQVQSELGTNLDKAQSHLDERINLLKEELTEQLSLSLRQQLNQHMQTLRNDLEILRTGGVEIKHDQLDDIKDHVTSVQSIDTDFWQTLQTEIIQQAHEASKESAEEIARHTIRIYQQNRRHTDLMAYFVSAIVSCSILVAGYLWLSGVFD